MVFYMNKFYNRCLFYHYRSFSLIVCSIILILVFICSFLLFFFVKFNFCFRYNGFVIFEGGDFHVNVLVSDNWIAKIQNFRLVYSGEDVLYKVVRIDNEYVLDDGLKRSVIIDFDIKESDMIVNNVLDLCFIRRMTFFSKVKEMFI